MKPGTRDIKQFFAQEDKAKSFNCCYILLKKQRQFNTNLKPFKIPGMSLYAKSSLKAGGVLCTNLNKSLSILLILWGLELEKYNLRYPL